MSRSINYSASPLLASKTPVWRSKFIVAALAVAFAGLAGRAAYVQVFGNDFFQRQGEVRFARTLELPANRGKVLDRNGLILASSVVAQSIWAIPEDVDRSDPRLAKLARLLDMPLAELRRKAGGYAHAKQFRRLPEMTIDPDHAVALGAAVQAGTINSNLQIDPGQTFELGGGQEGGFVVTGTNTGPVAVVVLSKADGAAAVERATVAPGGAVDAQIAPGEMALARILCLPYFCASSLA